MKKELNLRKQDFIALHKKELQEIDGGGDPTGGLLLGIAAGLLAVYELGKAIGREIYYETHDKK